ncbi:MAG: hypothetical protein HQL51_07660 [Magnetococcales bacterium]|nr:hypothetical protein [Magnetococcales bacterium]
MSQLEARSLQSREYEGQSVEAALKALIAALQDEGYVISAANSSLGLVTAAVEFPDVDSTTKSMVEFWKGAGMGTYQTVRRVEVSGTVNALSKSSVRIRINIVAKALNNAGGSVWSAPVQEPKPYQDLFSKVDKALFLEREKM